MQPISQTTYDLKYQPFDERNILDHSNAELVAYSDPHCASYRAILCKIVRIPNSRHLYCSLESIINISYLDPLLLEHI